MNDTGRKQQGAHIADSLLAAGIGRVYHGRSLSELPNGEEYLNWIKGSAKADVRNGTCVVIEGTKWSAYDTTMLLCRALHLSGVKCRVVPLRRLVAQVMHDGDELEDYANCDLLCVLDFVQQYPGNETPLTGIEVQMVEAFLHERMDNQRALMVHVAGWNNGMVKAWWSFPLLDRLHQKARVVRIP